MSVLLQKRLIELSISEGLDPMDGNVSYMLIDDNGNTWVQHGDDCHYKLGDLRERVDGTMGDPSYLLNTFRPPGAETNNGACSEYLKGNSPLINEDDTLFWLDWLLKRSPWSHIYGEMSALQIIEEQVFIVDCDHPTELMMQAILAMRHSWEFPGKVGVFRMLVDGGCGESAAFLISEMSQVGIQANSFQVVRGSFSHEVMQSLYLNNEGLCRWFYNAPPESGGISYKRDKSYRSFTDFWSCGVNDNPGIRLDERLRDFIISDTDIIPGLTNHIFKKAKIAQGAFSEDIYPLDKILPGLIEFGQKLERDFSPAEEGLLCAG